MKRLLITLLLMCSLAFAIDFEVGYELDEDGTHAPFVYITDDFYLNEYEPWDTQFWLSPSLEIEFNTEDHWEFWIQLQLLVDGPLATLSTRAKYTSEEVLEFRVGVLFSVGD